MIYNNYRDMFDRFQSINPEFNSMPTWHNATSAGDLAGRIIAIRKGGEKERLTSLAQFILQQLPHDTTMQRVAAALFERANALESPAAASRKKTHKVYKKTKKQAPKAKKHAAKKKKATHVKKKSSKRVPKPHAKKSKSKAKNKKKSGKKRKVTHQKHKRQVTHHRSPTPVRRPVAPVPPPPAPIVDEWMDILNIPDLDMPPDNIHTHNTVTDVQRRTMNQQWRERQPAPEVNTRPANVDASIWDALREPAQTNNTHTTPVIRNTAPIAVNKKIADAFQQYDTNVAHLRHKFTSAIPSILPMPTVRGFSLNGSLEQIISYISPSWPNDFEIYDDGTRYSKSSLLQAIRNKINDLHSLSLSAYRPVDLENQRLLQRMYANIFLAITNKINTVRSLSKKEKTDFDRSVRSFIQSLGITFNHCSDRLTSDSTRFYMQFVENKIHAVEDDQTTAIDEKLHRELIPLRKLLFQEAYNSTITNPDAQHDADTQRWVQHELNDELGLYFPRFNNNDAFSGCANRDKVVQTATAFYKLYTPARIADYLNNVIKNAIEDNSQGKIRQNWYNLITQYLQNKHAGLDLSTVYDLENNCFTPHGLTLLLSDLGIVIKTRR